MPYRTMRLLPCLLLACAVMGSGAQAQEDKKAGREREMLRRAQQALKQGEEQRAALQAEKSALEEKLKAASAKADKLADAEQKLAAAQRRAGGLEAELSRSRSAGADLEKKLAEAGARFARLSQEHTEALRTIASRDSQVKLQQGTLTQVRGEIAACEDKNAKLYGFGTELIGRYRDKSPFEAIRQAEPLTGLKQAQMDNLMEEYRDKLDAQRIRP